MGGFIEIQSQFPGNHLPFRIVNNRAKFPNRLHWPVWSILSLSLACVCRCRHAAFVSYSKFQLVNGKFAEALARCPVAAAYGGFAGQGSNSTWNLWCDVRVNAVADGRAPMPSNAAPTNAPNWPHWKSTAIPCTK